VSKKCLTHTKTDSKFFFVQEHTFEEEDDDEPVVDEQTPTVDETTPVTLPSSESAEAAVVELVPSEDDDEPVVDEQTPTVDETTTATLQEGFVLVEVGLYLRTAPRGVRTCRGRSLPKRK
jgi:hypothetical protein